MKVRNFDSELTATLGGTGSLVSGSSLVNLYRDTVTSLTNRSGSARFAGDVVIVDTSADSSFTISASCNTLLPVGVLLENTAVGSNGRVRFGGLAESVSVGSNVTAARGSFLYHSSTPTRANPMFGTAPSAGAFGYVVAQGSNTAPKALIFPTYDGAGGAASLSYGSNSTRVREISTAGVATEVARHDHAHDGIGTITASSSNTMQRGTWNLRPGAGIALNLSDTDGDGEFDTTTIVNTGSGGGGGGSGLAFSYLGYNTAGASTQLFTNSQNNLMVMPVTLPAGDCITSIEAYVAMTSLAGTSFMAAVYDDSGSSAPRRILSALRTPDTTIVGHTPTTPGWIRVPLVYYNDSGSSQSLWIGFACAFQGGSWQIYYDGSGTGGFITMTDAGYIEDGDYRGSYTAQSRNYSIRALVLG